MTTFRLLAEDPTIISWDSLGRITISDPGKLSSEVLMNYFRHSNFSSFQRQLNYFGYYKISGKGKLERCVYTNNALRREGDGQPGIEVPPYSTDALLRLKRKSSRDGAAAAIGAAEKAAAKGVRPATARQSSRAQKSAAAAAAAPMAPVAAVIDPRATKRQRSDTEGTIVTVATAETSEDRGACDDVDDHPDFDSDPGVAPAERWVEDVVIDDLFGGPPESETCLDGLGRARVPSPSWLTEPAALDVDDFLSPPHQPEGVLSRLTSLSEWAENPIVQTRSELWIGPPP